MFCLPYEIRKDTIISKFAGVPFRNQFDDDVDDADEKEMAEAYNRLIQKEKLFSR